MSKLIKEVHPNAVVVGNINPPRTGSFEVKINNKVIFSKFERNCFPTKEEIFKW